jgi:hypothetical protein
MFWIDLVGTLASSIGLGVSVWVLVVAQGAKKAAEEARTIARRKNLLEELGVAEHKMQELGVFLQQEEWIGGWPILAAFFAARVGRLTSAARSSKAKSLKAKIPTSRAEGRREMGHPADGLHAADSIPPTPRKLPSHVRSFTAVLPPFRMTSSQASFLFAQCNRVLPCADLEAAARVGKGHSS